MNEHEQYIHDELSRIHQLLDRFSIDDHALNNKTFREFLRQASVFVWESLVEFDHITTPADQEDNQEVIDNLEIALRVYDEYDEGYCGTSHFRDWIIENLDSWREHE